MGWDSIRCSRGCAADGSRSPDSHARPQQKVRRSWPAPGEPGGHEVVRFEKDDGAMRLSIRKMK